MIYKDTDFELVKRNIEAMSKEVNTQMKNAQLNQIMTSETPPSEVRETPRHQQMGAYSEDLETVTEDMSMSCQQLNEINFKSG